MRGFVFLPAILLLLAAEPPKAGEKPQPRVTTTSNLGLPLGLTTKITLRGALLDSATAVRIQEPKASAKLLPRKQTKDTVKKKERTTESQIEIEITLEKDFAGREASVVVVTPAGEGPPCKLLVERTPVLAEKEPNDSFVQAQVVQVPQLISGSIGKNQDVDVYRFEGRAGQRVVFEIQAARLGSPLDSRLTLFNADGQVLEANDDHGDSRDSRLEVMLPRAGSYFVCVSDANDLGGPDHVYRMLIKVKE
jgi:hypothetical protein